MWIELVRCPIHCLNFVFLVLHFQVLVPELLNYLVKLLTILIDTGADAHQI
jgi:hypothetical protein